MLLAFLILLVTGLGCLGQIESKNELPGLWKVEKLISGKNTLYYSQLGEPKVEFNKEGGYMINLSGQIEKGTYKWVKSAVMLRSVEPSGKETELRVRKLNSEQLEYQIMSDSVEAILTLRKIAPPWSEADEKEHEREEKEKQKKRSDDSESKPAVKE